MARNAVYRVKMRRRREGRTDYRKRLTLLKSKKIRAVIRKTNRRIIIQFVEYQENGDKIITGVTSDMLKNYGWKYSLKSIPASYLTGYLGGKIAIKKNIKEAVLDMGLYPSVKGSRIYSSLRGIIDAGIEIPHSDEIFPPEDRIVGKHIGDIEKDFKEVKSKLEAIK